MDAENGLTAQERAGKVAWLLARGARLRTREVARLVGLSERGARSMLNRLCRVMPISNCEGIWMADEEKEKGVPPHMLY